MGPPKRRKTYLDPGSSSRIPKVTKWRLKTPANADPAVPGAGCVPSPAARRDPLCCEPNEDLDAEPRSPVFSDSECDEPEHERNEPFSDAEHQEPEESEVDEETPPASRLPQQDDSSSADPIFDTAELAEPFDDDSPLTRGDAYMMLLDVAIKNGFSWTAVEDVQKLFNKLINKKVFPESKYLLKKLCGVDMSDIVFHFYCNECMALLAKTSGSLKERQQLRTKCDTCHKVYMGRELVRAGSFFVALPLKKQLASLLASKTVSVAVANTLEKVSRNDDGCATSDITDGHQYRAVRAQAGMSSNDLTLTLNSDGSPVFNSSNYSIWPVQVTLNELPPKLRWANVMMPLLWYGKQHPDMTLLLQAFVDQLENLNETGVTWTCENALISSKVFCICCCADAPARAAMQHMMQYNGYFGCSWCYHPGVNVEGKSLTISLNFYAG
ncbi:uncharacterized protein ISCGN_022185 [Ixodes scapularis]